MILVSKGGMMSACRLVRETKKAWIINYNDKAYPDDVRINKLGDRQLFESVDEAFNWLGVDMSDEDEQ